MARIDDSPGHGTEAHRPGVSSARIQWQGPVPDPDDVVMVLSTAPDLLLAKRIGHMLVEEGHAACVNLSAPGLSMYLWQEVLEGAEEITLTMKTTGQATQALIDRLVQLHPYEVPEVLVMPVLGASAGYREWVRELCNGRAAPNQEDK
jgi:periplasmic divalent cation tolerance protein